MFVFDDLYQYPHMEKIHPYLIENGFSLIEKTLVKAAYIKNAEQNEIVN